MKDVVDAFNKEHEGIATATITFTEKMPMFEKNNDEYLPILFEAVVKKLGLEPEISTFHAGAETHIYANNKNKFGVQLKPVLVGLADIYNMHSVEEQIDYVSYLKGYELLKEFFKVFNK